MEITASSFNLRANAPEGRKAISYQLDERWIGVNPPGHTLAGKRGRIC